jgi:hypothetical protein
VGGRVRIEPALASVLDVQKQTAPEPKEVVLLAA